MTHSPRARDHERKYGCACPTTGAALSSRVVSATVRKVLTYVALLAVIAGAGYAYWRYGRDPNANRPSFKTVKVERGKLASKVTATGTLSARVTVQVGSQVSGRIAELFVDFNSKVTKGMVLAKLDPKLLHTALSKAQAQAAQAAAAVAKAKANHEQANKAFARAKALKDQGLMGQADYDLAETAVASTKADIAVAQAQLSLASASAEEARVNLGYTTILSPIDGIVLEKKIDVGQTVAASLQAPVLFTIAQDLRSIQVDTFVAEADVGKLSPGMEATFSVDAYPGTRFRGKVREVRNAAQTVQNVVTYDAVLDVQNEELRLKPGMTANVTFVWAEKDAVLKVANAALRFKPPAEAFSPAGSGSGRRRFGAAGSASAAGSAPPWMGPEGGTMDPNRKTLWVLRDGKPHPVRVETGITDGTNTELLGDKLNEGDEVITEYVPAAEGGAPAGSARPPGASGMGGRGGRMF